MGSLSRRQKRSSRKFNTVSKQNAALARWSSTGNPSQQQSAIHQSSQIIFCIDYVNHILKILYIHIGVVNEVPITEGDTITSDAAKESYTPVNDMSNTDFHNADTETADTTATVDSDAQMLPANVDSDVVQILPANTTATIDSDVVQILPANTTATIDSDVVHTLPVEKCHLEGSRLFNLQNLHNAIKTIS